MKDSHYVTIELKEGREVMLLRKDICELYCEEKGDRINKAFLNSRIAGDEEKAISLAALFTHSKANWADGTTAIKAKQDKNDEDWKGFGFDGTVYQIEMEIQRCLGKDVHFW
jgi:hypothetical protein